MKKLLKKRMRTSLHHYVDGQRIDGANDKMTGNCTDLWGNCTGLWGNCTGLQGDCSGLQGDCTGLQGNLYLCEITDEDRKRGIKLTALIKEVVK